MVPMLLPALTLPPVPAAGAAAAELPVAPGTVVRWGGAGTERCAAAREEWGPVDGVCYYPVDLLAGAGTVEVRRRVGGAWRTARLRVSAYPYPVQRIEIEDGSRVSLSPQDLERARREAARVGALWSRRTPRRFDLPLGAPLAELPDGGRFGSRRVFNGEPRSPHTGADYAAPAGTPVLAVADGTVVLVGEHFFAGKSVFVDHGDGLISMSFHLSGIAVEDGEQVERGEILGTVGSTGRATGPHLHFGLRWRGARVDPGVLVGSVDGMPEVE